MTGLRSPPLLVRVARSLLGLALASGCAPAARPFPAQPALWRDPDRRPFAAKLDVYFSPHDWDRLDKSIFRPLSEFLLVRPAGESTNVNALDEVPDSSWFENRSGDALSPAAAASGPCNGTTPLDGSGPWRVVGGKTDGATPGFTIEAPDQHRYLLKVDGLGRGPRATLADVVGSRLYHAAGFRVPCYTIVYFQRSILQLDPKAHAQNEVGAAVPLTWAALDGVLGKAQRLPDGRYRVAASRFLDGRPLGPWRYHSTLDGDRNDVVPHEDRRELRAMRLLAAWTDHADQREENTLAMWRETGPGEGFVLHHVIDFSDCFGSLWGASVEEARRRGYTYWFSPPDILADFGTLGLVERPWERAPLGALGLELGLYESERFDPERWVPRYPNPALSRMTERDAAWMARIIARLDPASIEAVVAAGQAPLPFSRELVRIMLERREKILRRYLTRLSPLAEPTLVERGGRAWLCARDLALQAGIAGHPRIYEARAWWGTMPEPQPDSAEALPIEWPSASEVCVPLPNACGDCPGDSAYLRVELAISGHAEPKPIRFHLYQQPAGHFLIAGLERLDTASG